MAQTNQLFPSGLYKCFRPFADAAGLEALDTDCDLRSDGGDGKKQLDFGSYTLVQGNATNEVEPLVGLRTKRAVDLIRVTLTKCDPSGGNVPAIAPAAFKFGIKLGHGGCDTAFQFLKTVKPTNLANPSVLIGQISGLAFDTVQLWAGMTFDEPGAPNLIALRCVVYRCGYGKEDDFSVIDGQWTT